MSVARIAKGLIAAIALTTAACACSDTTSTIDAVQAQSEEQTRLLQGKENVFVGYEKEVLDLLARPHLGDALTSQTIQAAEFVEIVYTGVGYLLTVRHPSLPTDRMVLDSPLVHGAEAGLEHGLGFVVFIEDHEMTLECFALADVLPSDIRERQVVITTSK